MRVDPANQNEHRVKPRGVSPDTVGWMARHPSSESSVNHQHQRNLTANPESPTAESLQTLRMPPPQDHGVTLGIILLDGVGEGAGVRAVDGRQPSERLPPTSLCKATNKPLSIVGADVRHPNACHHQAFVKGGRTAGHFKVWPFPRRVDWPFSLRKLTDLH